MNTRFYTHVVLYGPHCVCAPPHMLRNNTPNFPCWGFYQCWLNIMYLLYSHLESWRSQLQFHVVKVLDNHLRCKQGYKCFYKTDISRFSISIINLKMTLLPSSSLDTLSHWVGFLFFTLKKSLIYCNWWYCVKYYYDSWHSLSNVWCWHLHMDGCEISSLLARRSTASCALALVCHPSVSKKKKKKIYTCPIKRCLWQYCNY